MSDQLLAILTRFHRETLLPHFQRIETRVDAGFKDVDARLRDVDARLRDVDARFDVIDARFRDVDGHFDSVYQRFDRLETEYHMLVAAVRRVEGHEH